MQPLQDYLYSSDISFTPYHHPQCLHYYQPNPLILLSHPSDSRVIATALTEWVLIILVVLSAHLGENDRLSSLLLSLIYFMCRISSFLTLC